MTDPGGGVDTIVQHRQSGGVRRQSAAIGFDEYGLVTVGHRIIDRVDPETGGQLPRGNRDLEWYPRLRRVGADHVQYQIEYARKVSSDRRRRGAATAVSTNDVGPFIVSVNASVRAVSVTVTDPLDPATLVELAKPGA